MSEELIKKSDAIKAIHESCFLDEIEEAIYELPTIEPIKWVPCSERLPSEDGWYLIALAFEWGIEYETGQWADGKWWNANEHVNVAWMPLPEPYDSADMRGADDE